MPELPEIETIRRDLSELLTGEQITSFQVFDPRLMSPMRADALRRQILGERLLSYSRRGKYLFAHLSNHARLVFHMRMTGQLIISRNDHVDGRRMKMAFKSGKALFLCDQRRFAEVSFIGAGDAWTKEASLGPDALDELSEAQFRAMLKKRSTCIQPLLMNQALLAGVGNIYAQEALFSAAIRPTRPCRRVSDSESKDLFIALRQILETAIARRGSTSRNYRDARGEKGQAQLLHRVYQRGGEPCYKCAAPLRAIRVGGRGSVYCTRCQK